MAGSPPSLCENSGCVSFRGAEEPALSGAEGRRGIPQVTCLQGEIPRGVYPEPPHFVRGRSQAEGERAQDDMETTVSAAFFTGLQVLSVVPCGALEHFRGR